MPYLPGHKESLRERSDRTRGFTGKLNVVSTVDLGTFQWDVQTLRFEDGKLLKADLPEEDSSAYPSTAHVHNWPGAKVERSTNVAIPIAAWTVLSWQNEVHDQGNCADPATLTVLTAPEDGIYAATANIYWDTVGAAVRQRRVRLIDKDGGTLAYQWTDNYYYERYSLTTTVKLATGDTVRVEVYHQDPGPLAVLMGSSFAIQKVSDTTFTVAVSGWPRQLRERSKNARAVGTGGILSTRWTYNLAAGEDARRNGSVGSDGAFYFVSHKPGAPAKKYLICLESNGTQRWKTEILDYLGGSNPAADRIFPTVLSNGLVVISDGNYSVVAYNQTTGLEIWRYTPDAANFMQLYYSPQDAEDGYLYVAGNSGAVNDRLYKIDATTGLPIWALDLGAIDRGPGSNSGAVAIKGSYIYVPGRNGDLTKCDRNGNVVWSVVIVGASPTGGPVICGDYIYLVGTDVASNALYKVRADTGANVWTVLAGNCYTWWATPSVKADGSVYVGGIANSTLYARNPDGTALWTYTDGGHVGANMFSPVIDSNGRLIVLSDYPDLYYINTNGTLNTRTAVSNVVYEQPITIINGTLYVAARRFGAAVGYIRAYETTPA